MTANVVLLPSLKEKIQNRKFRSHLKIISNLIIKLEKMGKNALKTLDVEDYYLLCEMKTMKPPYRLYVIVNEKTNTFYIVDWEHKERQNKVINELKNKLSLAIQIGFEKVFI